ncbi:MAG TPA: FAD-dependent monooxygenase [Chloroflexota bacterium]|jgi:salicylate hydroxylase/6-hydroxynicotinate 3-monooxygenase|nr:FAD-dependent monooxygenase [Chloroflexota bacterium]
MSGLRSVAIVGAGIGGLAAAATLRRIGLDVQVYEQASRFARVGAGIQMMPNSMKVLRGLGLEDRLRQVAFAPQSHLNREWDSGAVSNELPMPAERYGAPYLCLHRAELHAALASLTPGVRVHLGKRLVGLAEDADGVELAFGDSTTARADIVVGADGVHSVTRELLLGKEEPIHRGRVAYRAVFPAALLGDRDLGSSRTKWWGPDRHIVIYYTTRARDEVYFVTSVPEPLGWLTPESWSATGDVVELRRAFDGFHDDVQAVLEACPACHRWAILEREPLPAWSRGRVVMVGDAAHPMTPYMAQGGATAIEDAAVLARCLSHFAAFEEAFARFEALRKPRTARIQAISSANTWLRTAEGDTSWLYGYDAWTLPLEEAVATAV